MADPGFPKRGDANLRGGGTDLLFWPFFLETRTKL